MKPDCNKCVKLNLTEKEQNRQTNGKGLHICQHYNKRVLHRTVQLNHSDYLYPCAECESDQYSNYQERR